MTESERTETHLDEMSLDTLTQAVADAIENARDDGEWRMSGGLHFEKAPVVDALTPGLVTVSFLGGGEADIRVKLVEPSVDMELTVASNKERREIDPAPSPGDPGDIGVDAEVQARREEIDAVVPSGRWSWGVSPGSGPVVQSPEGMEFSCPTERFARLLATEINKGVASSDARVAD